MLSGFLFVLTNYMKNVELVFPDTESLVEFILTYRITTVETNAAQVSMVAQLNQPLIKTAVVKFGATVKPSFPLGSKLKSK